MRAIGIGGVPEVEAGDAGGDGSPWAGLEMDAAVEVEGPAIWAGAGAETGAGATGAGTLWGSPNARALDPILLLDPAPP